MFDVHDKPVSHYEYQSFDVFRKTFYDKFINPINFHINELYELCQIHEDDVMMRKLLADMYDHRQEMVFVLNLEDIDEQYEKYNVIQKDKIEDFLE